MNILYEKIDWVKSQTLDVILQIPSICSGIFKFKGILQQKYDLNIWSNNKNKHKNSCTNMCYEEEKGYP